MIAGLIALAVLAGALILLLDRQGKRHQEELEALRKERQNLLTRIQDPIAGVSQGFEMAMPDAPDKPFVSEDDEITEWEAQMNNYSAGE